MREKELDDELEVQSRRSRNGLAAEALAIPLKPRKAAVEVHRLALAWMPEAFAPVASKAALLGCALDYFAPVHQAYSKFAAHLKGSQCQREMAESAKSP